MGDDADLNLSAYACDACSRAGAPFTALVRASPYGMMLFDKIVIKEFWCCARCFEPKFDLRCRPVRLQEGRKKPDLRII